MKSTAVFIFIIFSLPVYSQIISGTVYDNNTREPIPGASVFFNGTTVGTYTNESGYFRLILPDNQKLPIAITSIGYNSILESAYSLENPLKIYMTPKVYELGEVLVYSKMSLKERMSRNRHLNQFKDQFLGTSAYARGCEILNEKDLVFQYSREPGILSAYSNKPLLINNKALGYQVTYYLDKFEYSVDKPSLVYLGNYIYKADNALKGAKQTIAERRRRLAYLGSRMHFFRALWENNLDSAGFEIKNISNQILTYDSLVFQTNNSDKYLNYNGLVFISYYSKMYGTTLQILRDKVIFDKLGYFDPLGISWKGEMVKQRMGDQLPFDYKFR